RFILGGSRSDTGRQRPVPRGAGRQGAPRRRDGVVAVPGRDGNRDLVAGAAARLPPLAARGLLALSRPRDVALGRSGPGRALPQRLPRVVRVPQGTRSPRLRRDRRLLVLVGMAAGP